ncbi:MAG: gamma-glutamyltransferase, partial [Gammaproteobacteria bacterium]|nr:gamma-glutamyltransferase [Gammaproteobacteria bacterium]
MMIFKHLRFRGYPVLRTLGLTSCLVLTVFSSSPAWSQTALVDSGLKQPIIRYDSLHHPVKGRFGMVVSQNSLATGVGQATLARGGNAVDAAVAVGFALAVTLPRAGNLGGSGFMLAHLADDQKTIALDYRSV